jgi:hypothetical protein
MKKTAFLLMLKTISLLACGKTGGSCRLVDCPTAQSR